MIVVVEECPEVVGGRHYHCKDHGRDHYFYEGKSFVSLYLHSGVSVNASTVSPLIVACV